MFYPLLVQQLSEALHVTRGCALWELTLRWVPGKKVGSVLVQESLKKWWKIRVENQNMCEMSSSFSICLLPLGPVHALSLRFWDSPCILLGHTTTKDGPLVPKPTPLVCSHESESHSVVSDSLQPHGLCSPWNSPGQNTGVGSLSLLQRIFPTQDRTQVSCIAGRFLPAEL